MKIVLLEPLGIPENALVSMVRDAAGADGEVVYCATRTEDAGALIERSRDADIVVLSNLPYPREVLEKCPRLRYVCVAFTGVDRVDTAYCREKNISVSNCAGYATAAVADLVFGLVIGLYRNLPACDGTVRRGGTKEGLTGPELEGKKFGVVGAGAIGLRVARIARAFGCDVLAYSRTVKSVDGVTFTDLNTLLSECDIVSLHIPQNASTTGMIGKEQLARMKKSALLINTARGPVVDSRALADALNRGGIAGAGIDVFETEPPIGGDHPLLHAKNCLLTPHVGFATREAMYKRARIVASNIRAYLAGKPENLVE